MLVCQSEEIWSEAYIWIYVSDWGLVDKDLETRGRLSIITRGQRGSHILAAQNVGGVLDNIQSSRQLTNNKNDTHTQHQPRARR